MSLIDSSYFVGLLNIPNTNREEISERLTVFIKKFEPELLRDILGYSLYKAFKEGLAVAVPEQKWIDLRDGKEYTKNSKTNLWMGFTGREGDSFPGTVSSVVPAATYDYKTGRGNSGGTLGNGDYWIDPTATGTDLVDERLDGIDKDKLYVVEAGYGPRAGDEYDLLSGGGIRLLNGKKFDQDARWFITVYGITVVNIPVDDEVAFQPESLIADYVYWNWIGDQDTQTVGLGEVKAKAENAENANPASKMIRAWNDMSERIEHMYNFLQDNQDVYPEWANQNKYCMLEKYRINNHWGF